MSVIAIDTNIFIHLVNFENDNRDSHIDQLLMHLAKKKYLLGIDSTSKIVDEYTEKIMAMIRNMHDTHLQLPILRYWMQPELRKEISIDPNGLLMSRIRRVIHEVDEHADRAFVYVACAGDCLLVTNDNVHILSRRSELRSETRKLRGKITDFISSRTAVATLCNTGS
jgi:hypothetical protein